MEKQTHLQIVQQAYADFAVGNIADLIQKCADDIIWSSYDNPYVSYAGTFNGKLGVMDFFNSLASAIEYTEFTPKKFFDIDEKDLVIVRGHHTGKVKSTGKTFSHDWSMEFYFRDSKLISFFAFVDSRDQAQAFTATDKENVVRVSLTGDKKEDAVAQA